ncbi:MAG: alpha/beta hydrolase [Planctomycetota bacterium]
MTWTEPFVRRYGNSGRAVVLLHGGPGAPGSLEPLATALEDEYRAYEFWQRHSGEVPLTVARHVQDLSTILDRELPFERPIVLGHSWGAMLALAFAASHPSRCHSLILIGCGTFDEASRAELRRCRARKNLLSRVEGLMAEVEDPDERLARMGRMFLQADSVDPVPGACQVGQADALGHEETWADMMRCQEAGMYPAAFERIDVPVTMIHGAEDPHPGRLIRDGLVPHLPELRYVEIPRCGHTPWIEREASERFHEVLREALSVVE